jgi:hypothetical protein
MIYFLPARYLAIFLRIIKPYPLKQASCSETERLSLARAMTYAREHSIAMQMNPKEEVDGLLLRQPSIYICHSGGSRNLLKRLDAGSGLPRT